ncbi:peptidase U32 family protein [Desulforhabdus sp. TSK]|uniref:peptidase U32 family protein n=1 Tax=Desulforhabdus sp. TSK TaxID=2925014 RepID=UPI001FC83990|nr:peptidase U32 family protein [Desulforhabdus sp. TSK]GKT07580.1 hypothetical protein DSTSK_08850 [Desulforhabdus sp. TSK]
MSPEPSPANTFRAPELLAPAGHVESFFSALENGADAVYLGLRQMSARASAINFTLDELSTLVPYAHKRKASVYLALNSIMTAAQFPAVMDLLQSLTDIQVDALIVQDPGIFYLVRRFFPQLKLHASTLMAIHNSAGVNQLERMGAQRVVLARELSLEEIRAVAASTRTELEVFVHGALCYSYSGLCLTSSYRGGHGGLQGRCVQPCRLKFRQGRKEGFFLSCNDVCALPFISELKKLRVASLKIEGRMKGADYIGQVVKAYRLVLDAPSGQEEAALAEARDCLAQSPSRRLTTGFFRGDFNAEVLTPHRSGSSGLWAGTIKGIQGGWMEVQLRHDLRIGDRLRPESSEGREKSAFSLREIFSLDGKPVEGGRSGERILLPVQSGLLAGERLFKVGGRSVSIPGLWQKIRSEAPQSVSFRKRYAHKERILENWPLLHFNPRRSEESLILKVGIAHDLPAAFQAPAAWVMLTATRANLERVAKQRFVPGQKEKFVWSLPSLLSEKDLAYYRPAVKWFCDKGFRSWEVNNWGHFDLLHEIEKLNIFAGNRFNARNLAAMAALADAGCQWSVLSIEITREELQSLSHGPFSSQPIVTVYAWPPLFTSRLTPKLQEERPLIAPRGDVYNFRRKGSLSCIYADEPMSWLGLLPTLQSFGYRWFMVDLSDGPTPQGKEIERLLSGYKRTRADEPYSLFNFDRKP